MSPLKANVIMNNATNVLSITVGRPNLLKIRKLNIYLSPGLSGIRCIKVDEYYAAKLPDCYGVIRQHGYITTLVAKCTTLAECQAVALSDYIQRAGLELVSEESTQEV